MDRARAAASRRIRLSASQLLLSLILYSPISLGFGSCVDGSPLARVFLSFCTLLVGAVMCPACYAGFPYTAGHNAFRASQVPINSPHLKCTTRSGFSRDGGFNRLCALTPVRPSQLQRRFTTAPKLCRGCYSHIRYSGFTVAFAACHQCPDYACHFVGQRNRRHLF